MMMTMRMIIRITMMINDYGDDYGGDYVDDHGDDYGYDADCGFAIITFIIRISCWMMVKSSPGSSLITFERIIYL